MCAPVVVTAVAMLVVAIFAFGLYVPEARAETLNTVACKRFDDSKTVVDEQVTKGSRAAQIRLSSLNKKGRCGMISLVVGRPDVIYSKTVGGITYMIVLAYTQEKTLWAIITLPEGTAI